MQLNFTGRNIEITPALKTFTEEKLQRLLHRFKDVSSIQLVFIIENLTHIAEASLHFDNTDIHAKAESDNMYVSIDSLVDKLIAQLTKHKEKHEDQR